MKYREPVFILGCPRSGTTLLASLLEKTAYGKPLETFFITRYYKKLGAYGNLKNKRNFNKLLHDILKERAVKQRRIEIDSEALYDELEEISYEKIVNAVCMKMVAKKDYKAWGDKTPHYILDIDIIYRLFPGSKYIYIVRDGRDVALSLFNVAWEPFNILSCANHWKACNSKKELFDKMQERGQLFSVKYEELLDNAENILPELYGFLQEEYDTESMKILISKIKKGNYNKWKKKMSTYQVRLFENVAANTLKRFGYETSYEERGVNGLVSASYRLHEMIMRAKFLFKINVIDGMKIRFFGKEPFAE